MSDKKKKKHVKLGLWIYADQCGLKVGGTADVSMPSPWNLAYGWASEP